MLRICASECAHFDFVMIYREWISNNSSALDDSSRPLPLFSFRQIGHDGKKKTPEKKRPAAFARKILSHVAVACTGRLTFETCDT